MIHLISAGAPLLLYTAGADIFSYDYESTGGSLNLISTENQPVSLDYHYDMGRLFWADTETSQVKYLIL